MGGIAWIVLATLAGALALPGGAATAQQRGAEPGAFDYYVLALSWNASWCEAEGDARDAAQCDPREDHGFTVHGLWPQNERGWPEWCASPARDPSRRDSAAMADIMGSGGLAWHQWKKHGRCTGLSGRDYYALTRAAWERVRRPAALRELERRVAIAPEVVEAAFLEANPELDADGVTITCRDGLLREVRVCLTRELRPRLCAPDTRRDCGARSVALPPMR
jgi:ribonuclease T2